MHVCVILATGVIIGFIVRTRRQGPVDIETSEVASTEPVTIEVEGWLHEFELTERSGQSVKSEDLHGAPHVASFFFTTCPASCPTQNAKLRILQQDFKDDDIRLLSISCDPDVDTPEVLAEYAERFNADPEKWLFLTGDLNYIRRVGGEIYSLPVNRRSHVDRFVLVDQNGKVFDFYEWQEPSQFDRLKADIRKLLDDGPPEVTKS